MREAPSAATCRGDPRHVEAAVHRLAAGHRHGVVEEDLVGDVDAGRRGGADGEAARVVVGAVAEFWKTWPRVENGASPTQLAPSAAHLGVALGGAVHVLGHVVAADAGIGARAFRHDGASCCADSRRRNRERARRRFGLRQAPPAAVLR